MVCLASLDTDHLKHTVFTYQRHHAEGNMQLYSLVMELVIIA